MALDNGARSFLHVAPMCASINRLSSYARGVIKHALTRVKVQGFARGPRCDPFECACG